VSTPAAPAQDHLRLVSPQPPDEVPPVEVAAAQALDAAPPQQDHLRLVSAQPPDEVRPVTVAEQPAAAAQALDDDGDDDDAVVDAASISFKDPDHSTAIDAGELPAQAAPAAASSVLDNAAMIAIIREVAYADSGADMYAAVSQDSEWAARGGTGRHFGLGFGLVLATQESGDLGTVLTLTRKRDAVAFNAAFGSDAEALLATTTAATGEARLAPVGGTVLWSDSWAERFRIAGTLAVCQAAQNEQAIEGLFRPMLDVATGLGLDTDRGLAMAFDRVVVRGLGGGLRWVVASCGPLRTQQQRDAALALLGHPTLAHFQATVPGLPQDGRFGAQTHAALVGALRRDGRAPLPSGEQLQCALVRAAQGAARVRLLRLRDSAALGDTAYRTG
jgi:hypothetical protein